MAKLAGEDGERLEELRRQALAAKEDGRRAAAIDAANAIIARLEASGALTRAERIELGRDWVRAYARDALPQYFRGKHALGVAQMTSFFLKTG